MTNCECACHRTATRHNDGVICCVRADPFGECDGCHDGDFPEFDHFCEALQVTAEEAPHAFAAWLGHRTGWDGRYERVRGVSVSGEKEQ